MPPRKLQRNLTDIYEAHLPTMNKMVSVPDISHFEDIQKGRVRAELLRDGQESSSPFRFIIDFLDVYRFGESQEKALMGFGIVLALCSGVIVPLFMFFWGKQTDHIIQHYQDLSGSLDQALKYYMAIVGLALGSFLINSLSFSLWKVLSERIAYKFRVKYVQAFVGRNMGWLEQQNLYEVSSKFRNNCLTIQKATGDKVALFYYLIGVVVSGAISAVCVRWTFALFLVALVPIGALALGYFIYVLIMRKNDTKEFFEQAQSQAVEATALIKTVKMLRCEKAQEATYNNRLEQYLGRIAKYPLQMGVATALFYFIQYFIFGVGFMFGIQCVRGTSACPVSVTGSLYSIGDMHIVFFQTYVCSYYFLQLASNYDSIKGAILSSKEAFRFIRDAELQDRKHATGKAHEDAVKEIQFRDVEFAYPSKPNRKILKRLNLKLLKNKFNAVVGATGSGKSTIAQLLLKFYQPNTGKILLGGHSISDLDAQWLRERVGYVGQQPTLFSGTLRENVAVGKADATDDQVWHALEQVNMRDFANKQPQGLDYDVGLGGQRLSGGQKQRVAIARALIKRPSLLILDEATSALDRKSQKLIQHTFQSLFTKEQIDMTVLCIAHRVRTIVKADRIFYLESGVVKEQGTFRELNYFKNIEMPPDEEMPYEEMLDELRPWKQLSKEESMREQVVVKELQCNIYSKLIENTANKAQYALGVLFAFLGGLSHPAAIYLLANVYGQEIEMITYATITSWCQNPLSPPDCTDVIDNYHQKAVKYLGGLIGFSVAAFLPYFGQNYIMTKIEDEITHTLRKKVFSKLMVMPVQWHERPENQGGQVGASSSVDVKNASTLVSTYIPTLVTNTTTVVSGIAVCIAYFWQVGLLSLVSIPLIAIGGYISMLFISGYEDEQTHKYEKSDKVATELMVNIKAVLALNFQKRMRDKYVSWLDNDPLASLSRGAKIGFFFGMSLFIILMAIGSALYVDNYIIMSLSLQTALNIVIAITVPMWCGWVAGNNFYFISKAGAGKESAKKIFQLLEEQTEAEQQRKWSGRGAIATPPQIKGRIEFKNVSFRYNVHSPYALKNVNLVIEGGQKAAFVGESGCGKSTLMLLLQRFYPFQGQITLDGVNIMDYDLGTYRSYFAVLNQEPSLFTGTVKQNVTLGTQATEQQLVDACRTALAYDMSSAWKGKFSIQESIHEFLSRDAGIKGSKLSGGQKQRVACARAVLKKPQVFLMDEGTSALDRDTEHRVQKNIDNSLKGITLVSIAHRIETIQDSDVIFLFQGGKVVESGKYDEMMARKTYFFNFVQGEKYKTINQIAELVLRRLVAKLLAINVEKPHGHGGATS